MIQPRYKSHTQAVELSTRGGDEFKSNVSRDAAFRTGYQYGGLTSSWQYTIVGGHANQPGPTTPPLPERNRALYFRFEPKHQFPFRTLHIDSINLPVYGMMSHFIGLASITIQNIPSPQPNAQGITYQDIRRVDYIGLFVGWDCDSALDVMNKYYRIMTARMDPAISKKMVTFEKSPAGALLVVVHIPNVIFRISFAGQPEFGYVDRPERFFGRGISGVNATFDKPLCGRDPMEFPFLTNIRLNTRLVTQQLSERNFSRNMEQKDQTQVIAVFPWASRTQQTVGQGPGLSKAFFANVPTLSETTLMSTKDFDSIQSMDIWFTYGENDDNLYEFFPLGRDSTSALIRGRSRIILYGPSGIISNHDYLDGNWYIDQQDSLTSTPRPWIQHMAEREITINMSFETTLDQESEDEQDLMTRKRSRHGVRI